MSNGTARGTLGLLAELLIRLLALIKKPDELDKVKKEIERLEKERDEKKKLFLKALAENDIPALNALFAEFFSDL